MTVIDVDSHYEPLLIDPADHPLDGLGLDLPPPEVIAMESLAGDLWNQTDPSMQEALAPKIPILKLLRGVADEDTSEQLAAMMERHPAADDPDKRVEWLDLVGIDFELVNPGGGYSAPVALTKRFISDPSDYQRAVVRCNDYLAAWTSGHTDRLGPATLIDVDDIEWSVREIERMRGMGSRSVFLRACPFAGRSPAHPANDPLWSAMASLGMVGVVHIGATPARFDGGWADADWMAPGAGGVGGYIRFANAARLESVQKFISALVFGGVFERVPAITVVLEELWASWLPWFVSRFDMLSDSHFALGSFDLPLSPNAYVRRNVRATPLPGLGDDGMDAISEVPEMLVFSSDFPHNEGNPDPIQIYGDALADLDPRLRSNFLGGTMVEVFARTGDPITVS